MSWKAALVLAAGGAIGTLGRYALSQLAEPISRGLPWGTVLINVLGSFIIGAFGALTLAQGRYPAPEAARLFVMVGMCGGFTTFSSFSLQTFDLLRTGQTARAFVNIIVSVALCLAAVSLGQWIGARLNGGAPQVAQIEQEELG